MEVLVDHTSRNQRSSHHVEEAWDDSLEQENSDDDNHGKTIRLIDYILRRPLQQQQSEQQPAASSQLSPPPAILLTKNTAGQLPIHVAIVCGARWSLTEYVRNCWPEAAGIRDGQTGLFPFQLAATAGTATSSVVLDDTDDEKENVAGRNDQLTLIYSLLRNAPQLLQQSM